MTDFQRDLEVVVSETELVNNGKLKFVMNHFPADALVSELDLSTRGKNALFRSGIKTFGQLIKTNLSSLRNIGKGTVKDINLKMMSYYYDGLTDDQKRQFWRETLVATAEAEG